MATQRMPKIRSAIVTELRRNTERALRGNDRIKFNQMLDTANRFPQTVARVRDQAITTVAKNEAFQELRQVYDGANEVLDERELAALSEDPPKRPHFPWVIFGIAVLKDALDAVTGSTLSIIFSAIYGAILFVYYLGKLNFAKKKVLQIGLKKMFARIGGGAAADAIPFLGFLPISSIMVIFAHYRDVKLIRVTLSALTAWQNGELKAVMQETARMRTFARKHLDALSAA